MKIHFFPRDITFWIYHCSALFIVATTDILFYANIAMVKFSGLFMLLFTTAILLFRYVYKKYCCYNIAYTKQIPALLTIGTLVAAINTTIVIVICFYVPFLQDFYSQHIGHLSLSDAMLSSFMLKAVLQSQLFLCSWMFIYTSISHQRRANIADVRNLQLENTLKSAQLENLTTQLNPHFLFNTLNNIRFMISESADMADDMMVSLSELLRYALEVSKSNKVPLGDEIAMLDKYIQLIKIQYEEKIIFQSTIPVHCHRLLIPPMMLQLLLENAIKYGVERSTSAGHIALTVSEHAHTLEIKLVNSLPTQVDNNVISMKLGLANIRNRLHLLYPEQAQLKTEIIDQKFIATLLLPKELTC